MSGAVFATLRPCRRTTVAEFCEPVTSPDKTPLKLTAVVAFVALTAFVEFVAVSELRLLTEYGVLVTGCLGERVVNPPPPDCLTRISRKRLAPGKFGPKSRLTAKTPFATATPFRVIVDPICEPPPSKSKNSKSKLPFASAAALWSCPCTKIRLLELQFEALQLRRLAIPRKKERKIVPWESPIKLGRLQLN